MIELLNIDCNEYMKGVPDKFFDLAICDPPYGIDINMNMGLRKGKRKRFEQKLWDKSIPDEAYFCELFRISKNQIIWGGNYFPLPLTKAWIFWDKNVPDGVDFADGELAWTSFDKTLVKINVRSSGSNGQEYGGKIHPTQKPVKLYKNIIKRYCKYGDKIFDSHLGSGSIAIACHDAQLDLVACEIDAEYYDAAVRRYNDHKKQLSIF